jgi:hypothetical protein
MTKTTRYLFALGLGASLVAACGDDDGAGFGNGGSGGRAGSGGTGGRAGAGGTGATAGRGGTPGTGGSITGGTGGTGGAGGSSAGTGGRGVVEPPDAGADAAVDSGPADSGVNGNCPNFATAAADAVGVTNQDVVISRVEFVSDGARVTFRGVGAGTFDFCTRVLCTGPDVADCSDGVQDLDPDNLLAVGEEASIFIDAVDPTTGELGLVELVNNDPVDDNSIVFAYIAWGEDFDSGLEENAANEPPDGIWTLTERVAVAEGDNTLYLDAAAGDINEADGYGACTGDGDTFAD